MSPPVLLAGVRLHPGEVAGEDGLVGQGEGHDADVDHQHEGVGDADPADQALHRHGQW